MAKAITAIDVLADKLVVDAIKTLVATYAQTKLTAGGTGTGVLSGPAGTSSESAFRVCEKILARRALKKTYRGNAGFSGDISSIGQVP